VSLHVKICGLTREEDVDTCRAAGVSAIGLNFVPSSPRAVTVDTARRLARRAEGLLVVGVVADLSLAAVRELVRDVPLGCVQLHGDESPELVAALLPHAYKAIRVASAEDVADAARFPGDHLLVDAKVEGMLGGTGARVAPALVRDLATRRKLTLAGGLTPANVGDAVRAVRPYCVDVASGVESAPGIKDGDTVRAFVANARAALARP